MARDVWRPCGVRPGLATVWAFPSARLLVLSQRRSRRKVPFHSSCARAILFELRSKHRTGSGPRCMAALRWLRLASQATCVIPYCHSPCPVSARVAAGKGSGLRDEAVWLGGAASFSNEFPFLCCASEDDCGSGRFSGVELDLAGVFGEHFAREWIANDLV